MDAWLELLTISADFIDNNAVVMLVAKDDVIGFYALEYFEAQEAAHLENLWVDPDCYGRQLFEHACSNAFKHGYQTMQWDADPEEHANESKTSLAYRAFRALGIDYRRAGCPAKIDNNEIGVLCTPRRAVLKAATYFVR